MKDFNKNQKVSKSKALSLMMAPKLRPKTRDMQAADGTDSQCQQTFFSHCRVIQLPFF
jgi:hypothetical protein